MADDVVRIVDIQAETTGVEQASQQLDKLADSQDKVADSAAKVAAQTDTVEKKQLSAQSAYQRLVLSVDAEARSSAKLEQAMRTLNAARDQGIVGADEYAKRVDQINAKYGTAGGFASAYAKTLQGLQFQMVALAGNLGIVGVGLSAFGPWGLAAAAGLGLVTAGLSHISDEAGRMGDVASALRQFSVTTGLSAEEIQALTRAGAEFGVTSQDIQTSIGRFSAGFEQARTATGPLYDQIQRIDGGLADQFAQAGSTAEALNVLAKAYGEADTAQRNALARTAFGRGGLGTGLVLNAVNEQGGVDGLTASMDKFGVVTSADATRWNELRAQIEETRKRTADFEASLYTEEVLKRQLQFYETQEKIIKAIAQSGAVNGGTSLGLGLGEAAGQVYQAPEPQANPPATTSEKTLKQLSEDTVTALTREANQLKAQTGILGDAATQTEGLRIKQDELTAAFLSGKISGDQYSEALARLKTGVQGALSGLQDQLAVAQAVSVQERLAAQQVAEYNALRQQGYSVEDASALAAAHRAVAEAQISSQGRAQLISLREQYTIITAKTAQERQEATYAQSYTDLIRQGKDPLLAQEIAWQQMVNATEQVNASVENQVRSLEQQTELIRARQNGDEASVAAAQAYDNAIHSGADAMQASALAAATLDNYLARAASSAQQIGEIDTSNFFTRNTSAGGGQVITGANASIGGEAAQGSGNFSQNVGIYGSTTSPYDSAILDQKYGKGNWQYQPYSVGSSNSTGGGKVTTYNQVFIDPQAVAQYQASQQQLTTAVQNNTAAVQDNTVHLSPFYTQQGDHLLGYRGYTAPAAGTFADGGVMTQYGPMPMRRYADGGVTYSPQMALFGEGSGPEAFIPLKGGMVPVQFVGANQNAKQAPTIQINAPLVNITSQTTSDEVRMSAYQAAAHLRAIINMQAA